MFGFFSNLYKITHIAEVRREQDGMSAPSVWVQERRLRTVYELLDAGNNKKVIAEVDRLLRKQPNFSCAKVLKALALIRMNKVCDAKALLEPVASENPTDDGTIQALSICYRELEDPKRLCSILEAACEKEKSEELLTHCFMALVRIQDYKKMHTVALQLYKLYNKPTYYGWVVASLVIKYDFVKGPLQQSDDLSLVLAERMMEKFTFGQKTPSEEHMLDLYLRILLRLAKWDKILDVFANFGYPSPNWRSDVFHDIYCLAMARTEKFDELFEYLKSIYIKNKDEYALLKQITDIFGETQETKLQAFFDELLTESPNRVVALADLYYTYGFCGREKDVRDERIARDIQLAVNYCVDKPSFYSDVMEYFRRVDKKVQLSVISSVAPKYDKEGGNYSSIAKIIRDVNSEIMLKEYTPIKIGELHRLKQANICFAKYLVCDDLMESIRAGSDDNLRTKESDYHDQFLVIAASCLLTDYYKCPRLNGYYDVTSYLCSQEWTTLDEYNAPELFALKSRLGELQNVKNNTPQDIDDRIGQLRLAESGLFTDQEVILALAISVLEYGLARSPYNYSMRVLLSRAYAKLGAAALAVRVIQGLDLKHVQWDSLGYLIFPLALTTGLYSEAMKMLVSAETMYTSFRRESMEHVIAAYKYGSFSKITEFLNFRKQLLASAECGCVIMEKRMLELMLFSGTSEDLYKYANAFPKEILVEWLSASVFADNRDFSVLQFFDEDVDVQDVREQTADRNYYMLKSRLFLLTIMIQLIKFHKGAAQPQLELLKGIVKRYESHQKVWREMFKVKDIDKFADATNPQLYGIWPHQSDRYFNSPGLHLVNKLVQVVYDIIISPDKPQLETFQGIFQESAVEMMFVLRQSCSTLNNVRATRHMQPFIEELHYTLEAFSLSRILLDVAISALRNHFEDGKSKGKQKDKGNHSQTFKKSVSVVVNAMLGKIKELHDCLSNYITVLRNHPVPRLDLMEPSLRKVINESFLSAALPSTFDVAQHNIRDAQLNQLMEMSRLAANLIEYLRNNFLEGR